MPTELTEGLLSDAAAWDVMKFARATLAQGQLVSSHWATPLLRGMVHSGETPIRASMVIKSSGQIGLCDGDQSISIPSRQPAPLVDETLVRSPRVLL